MTEDHSTKCFISYARKDRSRVDAIVGSLQNRNVKCWMDRRNIRGGSSWSSELAKAIGDSGSFVVFISDNATRKDSYVLNELNYVAQLRTKRIIPVYLASDNFQSGEVDLVVGRLQKIMAHGRAPDAVAEEIAAALGMDNPIPFPSRRWWAVFSLAKSKRDRRDLLEIGREPALQTLSPIVPLDQPLQLYPQYADLSLSNSTSPCMVIVGQAGAGKSLFVAELLKSQKSSFQFVFTLSPNEADRIADTNISPTLAVWGVLSTQMLERRSSFGLGRSAKRFPSDLFIRLLSKGKVLFVIDDLHLWPCNLSRVTSALLQFFRDCKIPQVHLYIVASTRRDVSRTDAWVAKHTRTLELLPLSDIGEGRSGPSAALSAQEVLWKLCRQTGHDLATLNGHRELFGQPLRSQGLRTPLFLALVALISSPHGENLPLDRALRLRTAELIEAYLRALVEKIPAVDFSRLLPSTITTNSFDSCKRFLLLLVVSGLRETAAQDLAQSLFKARGIDTEETERAIEAFVVGGVLTKSRFREVLALVHDSIEEYLLIWGFVAQIVDDIAAWRTLCRNRTESIAEIASGILRSGDDWKRLAFEEIDLATGILDLEQRHRQVHGQSRWTLGLDGESVGQSLARWATEAAPFPVAENTWRTIGGLMPSLGMSDWSKAFLSAIEILPPSVAGARACLEAAPTHSFSLIAKWLQSEAGQRALGAALAHPQSRRGFCSILSADERLSSQQLAGIFECWRFVRGQGIGTNRFKTKSRST